MFRNFFRRNQYEIDKPEILKLHIQLASTDIPTREKAYALLRGIKWGVTAQVEVDRYLFEFKQKLTVAELAKIREIDKEVEMGNPLHKQMSGKDALLMLLVIVLMILFFLKYLKS